MSTVFQPRSGVVRWRAITECEELLKYRKKILQTDWIKIGNRRHSFKRIDERHGRHCRVNTLMEISDGTCHIIDAVEVDHKVEFLSDADKIVQIK